tara:strand:+ start:70 stop:360 length:291 start_codon:yes stop_codon:yes gene_type:complete
MSWRDKHLLKKLPYVPVVDLRTDAQRDAGFSRYDTFPKTAKEISKRLSYRKYLYEETCHMIQMKDHMLDCTSNHKVLQKVLYLDILDEFEKECRSL